MLKYYHFIYTRRDATGWGLISRPQEGLDSKAIEALCRRLPVSEDGPVYALAYAPALGGFALCSSAACDSGGDHRGRMVADVIVAADPAARADPALAAVPGRFAQTWDPAWETQSPALEDEYEAPGSPTADALAQQLARLGVPAGSLPAFLYFLYRALPQQGVAFSLPVPPETAPLDALRALACLLSWAVPRALVRGGTASCGPEAVKDLRFYLSPGADRHLPSLPPGSAAAFFYGQAAARLRADPAGYLDFFQRNVLDVLPGDAPGWQAYPGLYLFSCVENQGEELLRQPALRALYLQNLDLFFSYQKEYPALQPRLRAQFLALAQALGKEEKLERQHLLAALASPGDTQAFAALPEGLRGDAALGWLDKTLPTAPGAEPSFEGCRPALACLNEPQRRMVWRAYAEPLLAGQTLAAFERALDIFRLSDEPRLLQARLEESMRQVFTENWPAHPENEKKLAEIDQFSRKHGLETYFEGELLRQLEQAFADARDPRTLYFCCAGLLRGLDERPAVRRLLDEYRPAAAPAKAEDAPVLSPISLSSCPEQELDDWLRQYDALIDRLAALLARQAQAERPRLPDRLRDNVDAKLVREAARRAHLSDKQLRELTGKRLFRF